MRRCSPHGEKLTHIGQHAGRRLSDFCAGIVQRASALFDERSSQLFAPVVQIYLFGDVVKIEGIGGRLAREVHAMQATSHSNPVNDHVAVKQW